MRKGEPVDPSSDKDTWELKRDSLMSIFFYSDGTTNIDDNGLFPSIEVDKTCCWLTFWHSVTGHYHKDFHWSNFLSHVWPDCLFVDQKFKQANDEYLRNESEQVHCLDKCQPDRRQSMIPCSNMNTDIPCTNNTTRVQGRAWTLEFAICHITVRIHVP